MAAPRPPGEAEAASAIAQEFEFAEAASAIAQEFEFAEAASAIAQEFKFILPRGFVDEHGELHRVGVMRLATALDELEPLRNTSLSGPDDPQVAILVLSRVIVSLGKLATVTPNVIEALSACDLAYLQRFYAVINFGGDEEMAPDGDC